MLFGTGNDYAVFQGFSIPAKWHESPSFCRFENVSLSDYLDDALYEQGRAYRLNRPAEALPVFEN